MTINSIQEQNTTIQVGQTLTGNLFPEPMQVVTVKTNGINSWSLGLVGKKTEQFRNATLTEKEIACLTISESNFSYDGDGRLLRRGLEAHSLGIAYEFDPYFGLSISRVDPLPHQLEAVYEHMLKLPTVRFLLADDAGAGKTVMAGLLIRELKLRGLVERVLVVCPANLTFQWQRELKDKFNEQFTVLKGNIIHDQFGANQWMERQQIITSLDFAKRDEILPGLRQVHWDLVIVDEAHRMSWSQSSGKTARYILGELLRDNSDHLLLLTATPHKGDPDHFTRFLQLLDRDVYADVKSIREAIDSRQAPFYLRRSKEAMVYFPEQQEDGEFKAQPLFTKRIPQTVGFTIDGPEMELYKKITDFVKRQSKKAAAQQNNPQARAVGFVMALYQRRLASSTRAMRCSLENRANRLNNELSEPSSRVYYTPPPPPLNFEEIEEMEYSEWERTEERFQSYTLACDAEQIREEIEELRQLTKLARTVEQSGREAKLVQLKSILKTQGFFTDSDQRLLVFTEFKDTLKYLLSHLEDWGFRVGCIHGGMKSGSRDEPGSRLHVEQQFREGSIQVLVATEAAGEGINLQCCHILFNYDIPWNPNRLEQRMGRIHRYGQQQDCLIFNFVATNTIEGRVLQRLMDKLQEIRQALDDDAVFNVIGDILPTAQVESVLRDYYSGKLGEVDLEQQMLKDVDESRFRAICQNALEGLATRNLNFNMLMERQAKAREQRIVPESTARFMVECALDTSLSLKKVANLAYTFDPGSTPSELKNYERAENWKLPKVSPRYPRLSTDRETADENNLEWVIPGHPLFEALRRHAFESAESSFLQGSCFYSLAHDELSRLDVYRARAVNGLGRTVHEWLFVIEISESNEPVLRDLQFLHSLSPTSKLNNIPDVAHLPEIDDWLTKKVLSPRLEKVRSDYSFEIKRIAGYVELSLTEVLFRIDGEIGRAHEDVNKQITGAEGRLAQAERRYVEITNRLNTRQKKLEQERAITLQGVERLTSILILPHPEREASEVRNLRPNPETEMKAMQLVEEYEIARGCKVDDVSESNLGYDLRSVDSKTGALRLIEVKGLSGISGSILLTPNERRVAEDRRDCYWLYIVTNCANNPTLCEPIKDPTRFQWKEISKVEHYRLEVNAMTQPMHSSESQKEIR